MNSSSFHRRKAPTARHDERVARATPNFPQTDYHYQATPRASTTVLTASDLPPEGNGREMRGLREISKPVIDPGFSWQFAFEATVFGLVGVLVAWSLVSLLIVLAQTARG